MGHGFTGKNSSPSRSLFDQFIPRERRLGPLKDNDQQAAHMPVMRAALSLITTIVLATSPRLCAAFPGIRFRDLTERRYRRRQEIESNPG